MDSDLNSAVRQVLMAGSVQPPPMPEITQKLLKIIQQDHVRGELVIRTLQDDARLVSSVLRAANADAASIRDEYHSLRAAASGSGARKVARLGIALSLAPQYRVPGYDANAEAIWLKARATAIFCEEIARRLGEHTEMAFVCGLFLNAGQLLVLRAASAAVDQLGVRVTIPTIQEVVEDMGGAVNRRVIKAWRLPKPIQMAMEGQRQLKSASLYREFVLIANLGELMTSYAGAPPRELLEKNPLFTAKHFPPTMLRTLGGQLDEILERAHALGGRGRLRRRLAG